PNGCGKSNLLEAMRWVMGETRPKAMRGGGMEDVIFAGAATRGARAFAEVSLHIDNTDRLAPAGFNDSDTLDITRRITRDLGSAYKANGKETRARDVQMLFADASTGAHSPALVRQGQIAELINAKPRARRRVLEEAAGISGLYHRRHEAELKLKSTEANLLRVDDVLDQLATRLGQLARQVRQAARYRAIGEDLRRAEASLHYVNWAEADQTRATTETTLRTARTAAVRAEHAARIAAETRIAHEAALPPLREEETIAATVLHRARADHAALTAQDSRARDQIAGLTRRIEQLARDAERETTLHHDAHDMIQRLTQEAQALEQANAGHTDRLSAAAQDAAKAATALQDREIALSEITE
ncbi:MAG: AAA family ATPase, partial [Paracoccaceae bacterium]